MASQADRETAGDLPHSSAPRVLSTSSSRSGERVDKPPALRVSGRQGGQSRRVTFGAVGASPPRPPDGLHEVRTGVAGRSHVRRPAGLRTLLVEVEEVVMTTTARVRTSPGDPGVTSTPSGPASGCRRAAHPGAGARPVRACMPSAASPPPQDQGNCARGSRRVRCARSWSSATTSRMLMTAPPRAARLRPPSRRPGCGPGREQSPRSY